ncbi:MAG TPA: dNTP triphosphohydrolase [Chthoniobacterales bacterium]|jgi:dGTPase|nr:dNTP triphosphohydrolase [Chthoniobacterales bacterium]
MDADHRVEFERDYDRSIFSTPVKRLQDKTQVFPLEPHDAVRTRLTHSLEVSAVARGLGIAIGKWLLSENEISPGMERQIEAISGTSGLIHDLGNPPFGHAGEDAIREWFGNKGAKKLGQELSKHEQCIQDLLKFEGNAQTLRLVSKLQILADFNGLNLTYGTLSAARKYIAASHEADVKHKDHAMSKPGFFASENDLIKQIEKETGTKGARNPITFLVEAADDIVYLVADIEDGIKKGIITWQEIEDLMRSGKSYSKNVKKILETKDRILKGDKKKIPLSVPDDSHGSAFRTAAISVLVPDAIETFKRNYADIMAGAYKGELVKDGKCLGLIKLFKTIGRTRIYCTAPNLKLELMGRKVIHDLLDIFWEGAAVLSSKGELSTADFPGRIGALLSRNYRDVFCHSRKETPELPESYQRYQLITDYICGMTDTFAKQLHEQLTNG